MSSLLATKLHRPAIPLKRVQRPQLIQRLNEGIESGRQMTLVSAPAGFGKTTCIGEWLNALDLPATWLSLDPVDDDPGRFFAYLVAALQKVDANLGQEIEGVLHAGQLPPIEVISTTLINDILEVEGRFVLVLDDFQVIQDAFILQVVEKLMAQLPPPLHLVLLTREDPALPLARLRANNQLTEIRAWDLRFTSHEAARFLNEMMGLSLSQEDIALLEDRTEGWIVGLQLAALSLRDRANPSSFIATLSGSHRFILSYLTEEVLNQQPEEIQHFLLQTSILDKLSGDVCNAVTGRNDSHFLLERLFAANLFLIPLDDEQQWYRYHHLFADLLRSRQNTLQTDQTTELHQRASHWYEQANMTSEAIQHALAATDYAAAVHLIESHALEMLIQGYAKTVEGWLQAIPPEWRSHSPRANLAFAWMYLLRGSYAQAVLYVERLQQMESIRAMSAASPAGEEDPSLRAEWLALQAMLLNMQGKPTESLDLANQALKIVPAQDGYVQSLIYMGLAGVYQLKNDYTHAVDAFQMIIRHGQAAANFISEMLGISGLIQMALNHGQYNFAFELASQGIERVERSGTLSPISAAAYGALGQVYYEWHQIELARDYFLRAIQLSTLGGYSDAEIGYGLLLSRLYQMKGNLEAASQELQRAVDLMQVVAPAWVREEVVSQQVRIALAQHRHAVAEAVLKGQGFSCQDQFSIPDLTSDWNITHPAGLLYNSALRILLYQAHVRREDAILRHGIDLADRLLAGATQGQYLSIALETLLLRAQMHAALGNEQASLADIARALELAEPEGYMSIFVQEGQPIAEALAILLKRNLLGAVQPGYVENILAAFSRSQPSVKMDERLALIEPLTERELEVLRLLAQGLKYAEIAERLVVSVNTVRYHVKGIYGKLGVEKLTKAIERARQLSLL